MLLRLLVSQLRQSVNAYRAMGMRPSTATNCMGDEVAVEVGSRLRHPGNYLSMPEPRHDIDQSATTSKRGVRRTRHSDQARFAVVVRCVTPLGRRVCTAKLSLAQRQLSCMRYQEGKSHVSCPRR